MTAQDVRSAVAAALATLLGACALIPVYASGRWFPPVLAVVLVVFAGGLLMRGGAALLWARVAHDRPVPDRLAAVGVIAVPLGQTVLLAVLFTALYAPSSSLYGVIPTPASLADLAVVFADGAAEVQEQAPPALALTGLVALTTLLVAFVAVIVDLIAVAGRQAAVAGLGLLVLYCVPVGTISGGIGLIAMIAPAAGLALLLWTDQHGRLASRERSERGRPVVCAWAPARSRRSASGPRRWSRASSSAPSSRRSPRDRSPPASAAARAAAPARRWTRSRSSAVSSPCPNRSTCSG